MVRGEKEGKGEKGGNHQCEEVAGELRKQGNRLEGEGKQDKWGQKE